MTSDNFVESSVVGCIHVVSLVFSFYFILLFFFLVGGGGGGATVSPGPLLCHPARVNIHFP